MVAVRALPADLVAALRRAHDAEQEARPIDQRIRAMRATNQLMLAAVNQGWAITTIAHAMGLDRHIASKRVIRARRLANRAQLRLGDH
jgi:hypothetical protein